MRFDARELKLYPEPVKVDRLVEDAVYFSVSYLDHERLIPALEPYVFSGRDLVPGDSGRLYFQSLDPVRRQLHHDPSADMDFYIESEEKALFFEYEQALEELMVCFLRRQGMLDHWPEGTASTGRSLQFDARELQLFSEPVRRAELKEGSIYFSVFFVDDTFLIPGLEPYIFVGRDIDDEEPGLYFQDAQSYRRGIRHDSAIEGQPVIFVVDSDDDLNHFEYEEALEQLMVCSVRRRGG